MSMLGMICISSSIAGCLGSYYDFSRLDWIRHFGFTSKQYAREFGFWLRLPTVHTQRATAAAASPCEFCRPGPALGIPAGQEARDSRDAAGLTWQHK